ncbi:hemerythrin domain-containing protein [Agriterribacter sp.]|uniref:hemerythrin domain-containing protein n=1 Tax=Agriterribacter sp. TaxID=2821509 RepID=UPI002CB872BC|nr:hemerythrin domain-containing protein [Agriterribacter sp.]HRO48238.1 hemerythrin domain-containing protein [Agriterribacter sp.]HRQ19186.1 hemerythrin domain-containing protein [Agriterribacter sp.]
MNRQLYQFFTDDHRRIDELLDLATQNPDEIQMEYYQRFRAGLLTHIKMEEKVLFPAAQKANGGIPVPLAAKLRLEHGAITALMVPPPTPSLIKVLRHVLDKHDIAEEEPGGMYDVCAALTQNQTLELLEQLAHISEVPLHPHHPAAFALEAAKRALTRAGYDFDSIA